MLPTRLRGARTHNLKGIDLSLEPGQVVALTGVSGAGKSSLALDTLYAEGQRRFVESFSPYARQFLERLERPPMDSLEPVPAAIAVDRRAPVKSSRSTLATMADIEPYIAALFVREAVPLCPVHHLAAVDLDATRAAEQVLAKFAGSRVIVTWPSWTHTPEQYLELRDQLATAGYRRLWLDGQARDIDTVAPSSIDAADGARIIVDRVNAIPSEAPRIAAALEAAWLRSGGLAQVFADGAARRANGSTPANAGSTATDGANGKPSPSPEPFVLRRGRSCPECATPLGKASLGLFSYESPLGACPTCRGFGRTVGIDWDKVIPDPRRTLAKGAIRPWSGKSTTWERGQLLKLCRRQAIPMDVPYAQLTPLQHALLRRGDGEFDGLEGWFTWLQGRTYKMHVRVLLSRYRAYDECATCQGRRLGQASLAFVVAGLNIAEWHRLEVGRARAILAALSCQTDQGRLAQAELLGRLTYLERVGLGYLTLDRQARTLSGGEAQRVTLTAGLGTNLHNALFVLDEPSVGLHASDVEALGELINELGTRNNSVIVIEHDAGLIRSADRVVELGPHAGAAGGSVTFDGTPAEAALSDGPTARALRRVDIPVRAPSPALLTPQTLSIRGATAHNLKNVDVDIPLGVLCAISGPSGSGKSTLSVDILYRALARLLGALDVEPPGEHREIVGLELIRKVILVDQSPLGRTSRGNAATYTKAWDSVRKLFASEPSALSHGLTPSHFSFNVALGRCETCAGEGFETVEMQFLADVRLSCPSCQGKRFKPEVLSIQRQGVNIAQVLEMTIDQTIEHFSASAPIARCLRPMSALGLGYVRLGQPLSTLSGGEAQRLKLARSLSERKRGSLWILDEPSAGLHPSEIELLLTACRHIVDAGGSVLMVEHDLEVIAQADWVIDIGPHAGSRGGEVVAVGPPGVILVADTLTGKALRQRTRETLRPPRPARSLDRAQLEVRGAREHNLKQVDVAVPHQALTVVTGPSGSGKSSLAFDVIFAEGQRRFLETLTPYARQFLPSMPRPDVDQVTGVPPSISLEQRTARSGSKSTVATVTEISHYMRLCVAKLGTLHCPDHDLPVASQSPAELLERLRAVRGAFELCAPAVRARKGTYLDIFSAAAKGGISRAYADGVAANTDTPPRLARTQQHTILLVIEPHGSLAHLTPEQLGRALSWGKGEVVLRSPSGEERIFSTVGACPECGFSESELDPRIFSFNTEQGRCATCLGDGSIETVTKKRGRPRKAPAKTKKTKKADASDAVSTKLLCPDCSGSRLAPLPRAVRLFGVRYDELSSYSVEQASSHFDKLKLSGRAQAIGGDIKKELSRRLEFLCDVGLGYLSLNRGAATLSGGEMQRLRLAAQLGAGLTGALYVLDEPTIGLHPKDTKRLLGNLRRLVDLGSTVLVVEHDADTVRAADHLIDLGPGGGSQGGRIMASGTPAEVLARPESPTGQVLSRAPSLRQSLSGKPQAWLSLEGASEHNLKDVELKLPLGRMTVVAGVSGSGKSTLIRRVLLPALRQALGLATETPGQHKRLSGYETLVRAVSVDQNPIGRTPRSVPATFLGIWDPIRRLFAATNEAKVAGFDPSRFSFNAASGGRCQTCNGMGVITHEMSFLPDVVQACPTCQGQRFEPRTLDIRYRGLTIGDVLGLPAERAAEAFANHPKIAQPLKTLCDLGTGYVTLGQGSHTLSGGEAQRLKLADELTASARHEPTLYVLDEPTTGLHLSDVARLMSVLDRLVARGDTLVIVEHHPWVIAGADYVVELGPGGGQSGGKKIAEGTPSELRRKNTATAQVLKELAQPLAPKSAAALQASA